MSTTFICLTQEQRKLAKTIILQIFRGDYDDALRTLTISKDLKNRSLPPVQESKLRHIVLSLQSPQEHFLGNLQPLNESNLMVEHYAYSNLNENISFPDIHIPTKILAEIYEYAMTLSYHKFYKKLQQWQWVEHTIIEHNIYLYEQCLKMRMAQQVMNHMNLETGINLRLYIQYIALLVLSYFLVILFRME